MKNLFDVSGKVAVVSGGSSGIGFMMAQGLLENGAKVMVPPFIDVDTRIIVKTEDLTYVERAKD